MDQARGEIDQITELIDEVLFLSELESGARVVALGATPVKPVLMEAVEELEERAARAGVELRVECDDDVELAIRPRMLRVVARNLAEKPFGMPAPARRSRSRSPVPPIPSSSPDETTESGSTSPSSRASSSASTGPIARELRVGQASGSRS